jgi:hypothetical protein
VKIPATLSRWLRREIGLDATDAALATHSRLIAGQRRDHETAVVLIAKTEAAGDATLGQVNVLAHQLNANTKHLAYLDGMLQYLARTSPGIGNAITAYRKQVKAATEKLQREALEAEKATKEEVPAPADPIVQRTLTLGKDEPEALEIPHAETLPFVDHLEAEGGEG